MSIRFEGKKRFYDNLNRLERKSMRHYRAALGEALLIIEAESMRRTPVDLGYLRSSAAGNSIVYKVDKKGAKGVMFYTANYAVYVHELTKNKHDVGEAKFLENAIKNKLSYIKTVMGNRFKTKIFGNSSFGTSNPAGKRSR